jgi:hypothetical protein
MCGWTPPDTEAHAIVFLLVDRSGTMACAHTFPITSVCINPLGIFAPFILLFIVRRPCGNYATLFSAPADPTLRFINFPLCIHELRRSIAGDIARDAHPVSAKARWKFVVRVPVGGHSNRLVCAP